jgi:hypothetical protein
MAGWENLTQEEQNDLQRHYDAAHAMQSGVAQYMQVNPRDTEPKHLRVGINTALVDHASLVDLLISKGVFSRGEYLKVIADGMEREKQDYEERLSKHYGANIKLA